MNEGSEYVLYAHALSHDGRAICRLNPDVLNTGEKDVSGQVIFVPNVLPAQKIIARIVKVKKKYALGELVSIISSALPSAQNICMHAHSCGGCILQKMTYAEQLFWKEKILADSIKRIAKIDVCPINCIMASPEVWNYRNKMEFAFAGDKGDLRLGLRAKASHEVINATHCKLMPEIAMKILGKIKELANDLGLSAYAVNEGKAKGFLRFIIIRIPLSQSHPSQCLINLISSKADEREYGKVKELAEKLMLQFGAITGFAHDIRYKDDYFTGGDKTILRRGQTILRERLSGIDYELGYQSFFQINTVAAEFLAKELELSLDLKGDEILWDLYSGVGAPSMYLANKVKQIYGVESVAQAVKFANNNAKKNNFNNCTYFVGQAHQIMRNLEKPDVVIMDPPRAGLQKSVIEQLLKIKPRQIVYISCDSATLSRDLLLLSKCYAVHRVQVLDFFPQTPHVESVVALKLI